MSSNSSFERGENGQRSNTVGDTMLLQHSSNLQFFDVPIKGKALIGKEGREVFDFSVS
jgi:hypothetical protein